MRFQLYASGELAPCKRLWKKTFFFLLFNRKFCKFFVTKCASWLVSKHNEL
jgi:hypothetical protein